MPCCTDPQSLFFPLRDPNMTQPPKNRVTKSPTSEYRSETAAMAATQRTTARRAGNQCAPMVGRKLMAEDQSRRKQARFTKV